MLNKRTLAFVLWLIGFPAVLVAQGFGNVEGFGAGNMSVTGAAGVISSGGTANKVTKFTAAQVVGNSTLTDDGVTVTGTSPFVLNTGAGADLTINESTMDRPSGSATTLTVTNSGVGICTLTSDALNVGANGFQVDSIGNLTSVNGVPYSWPGSQGAAGTTLGNDGAGNLSWSSSVTSTGASPQVAFFSSANVVTGDASLNWDGTSDTLSIGHNLPNSPAISGSPISRIHVARDASNARARLDTYGAAGSILHLMRANGTQAAPTAIPGSGFNIGEVRGNGYDGTAFQTSGRFLIVSAEAFSGTNRGSTMSFIPQPNAFTGSPFTAMFLDQDGTAVFGRTTLGEDVYTWDNTDNATGAPDSALQHILVAYSPAAPGANQAFVRLYGSNGTASAPGNLVADQHIGTFAYGGINGDSSSWSPAGWSGYASENWTTGTNNGMRVAAVTNKNAVGISPRIRLIVDHNGNVSISDGTPPSDVRLQVTNQDEGVPGAFSTIERVDTVDDTVGANTYFSHMNLAKAGYSGGLKTAPASGADLGHYDWSGWNSTSLLYEVGAYNRALATEAWSNTAHGTSQEFYVTANGSTTQTLAATIGQDANVGIGVAPETGVRLKVYNGAGDAYGVIEKSGARLVLGATGAGHALINSATADGVVAFYINNAEKARVTNAGNFNLVTGQEYHINNASVLSGTTLGSGVTASSLTSVGTLTSLTTSGNVTLTNTGTASELRLNEPSGSGTNYTAFKSQAQAADVTYTLPAAAPSAGDVLQAGSTPTTLQWSTARYTCTLNGGVTATCTATVPSGVTCTCTDSEPAVLGVAAVACDVSATTLTVTSSVTLDTSIVKALCL